jgi:uncharacterized protein YdeI (YjbR/CyaY-like superfamily)
VAASFDDAERVHPGSPGAWRSWLEENHHRPDGVWLVTWTEASGRADMTYAESVEEALCFGWVDSLRRAIDEERSRLWFAPRTQGSGWSAANKERIRRLEREGRMAAAGRRAVARAKADGSWAKLDAVERLEVPEDLAAAFAARPGSRDHWEGFPRSVKRGILEWIGSAKRPETRARRVSETADAAERGERANQWARR